MQRYTRRQLLAGGAAVGVAGLSGCSAPVNPSGQQRTPTENETGSAPKETPESDDDVEIDQSELDPVDVRGAMYIPSRAYNTYQMWGDYDPDVIERDLGYASNLELNSLRTWLSFELWEEDEEDHEGALDHFLETADDYGIRPIIGLFEGVGRKPTRENLTDTDPRTATGVYSPGDEVLNNPSKWDGPRHFVKWFMDRYRDDDRMLAIEAMNEPGWWENKKRFTEAMFGVMGNHRGDVPLTVGSTSLANNVDYMDWGSDVVQFHYNFPSTHDQYRDLLGQAVSIERASSQPVYLTEWQRIRSGRGFASAIEGDEWQPNYSSVAPIVHQSGVGNYFWSLMVKPAYVPAQRKLGVISGVFHEDGSVWSLDDARSLKAMSGDDSFDAEERREWPEFAEEAEKAFRG
ncbi:glycoside hydrolase family 5 protein [Halegenticoccus tardaugens]|uniref:glycoside hydrolase family 5 protein n=1 Tax=Halegenticoccus tardaugens TaxID=2071624 RepID=UPI001E29BBD6|nr:glycoside hydrolase family 5 protein [Halegenticoccus tardaugens]